MHRKMSISKPYNYSSDINGGNKKDEVNFKKIRNIF